MCLWVHVRLRYCVFNFGYPVQSGTQTHICAHDRLSVGMCMGMYMCVWACIRECVCTLPCLLLCLSVCDCVCLLCAHFRACVCNCVWNISIFSWRLKIELSLTFWILKKPHHLQAAGAFSLPYFTMHLRWTVIKTLVRRGTPWGNPTKPPAITLAPQHFEWRKHKRPFLLGSFAICERF